MHDGSQLLGHFRYPCTKFKKNASSHKVEKERKPHGKNPPPKREMKEDAWMDGVIKTLPLCYASCIYNREVWEEHNPKRGKGSPTREKKKGDKVVPPPTKWRMPISDSCFNVEVDPWMLHNIPPLWKKWYHRYIWDASPMCRKNLEDEWCLWNLLNCPCIDSNGFPFQYCRKEEV